MLFDLSTMTVLETRERLKDNSSIIVPLGCTEQHGYHMPLGTDTYTAVAIGKTTAEKTGAFIAPPVAYTFSGGELEGTVNVNLDVVALYIREICRAYIRMGMERVFLITGHGGSEYLLVLNESLKCFFRTEMGCDDAGVFLIPFWEVSETWRQLIQERDYHAAAAETSLMLYLHSDLVRDSKPRDEEPIASMLMEDPDRYQVVSQTTNSIFEIPHIQQAGEIKVGVMGRPANASAELGEKLFTECVSGVCQVIQETI